MPLTPHLALLASLEDLDVPPYDGTRPSRPLWWALLLQNNYPKERLGPLFRDEPRRRWVHAATDYDAYLGWVDQVLSMAPRGWNGFQAAKDFLAYFAAPHMPEPVRRHVQQRWAAWLSPDRPTSHFEHPARSRLDGLPTTAPDFLDPYVARTDDWRGNKSFFRNHFVLTQSTQNINITAVAGALLGGRVVNSATVMAEGRRGLQGLAYLWFWGAGTGQENHDHYYLGQTLVGLKVLADHAPTADDRLQARSYLTKTMLDLLDARHPALRRFTATSNRTSLEYVFHTQDGPDYVAHAVTGEHLHDVEEGVGGEE